MKQNHISASKFCVWKHRSWCCEKSACRQGPDPCVCFRDQRGKKKHSSATWLAHVSRTCILRKMQKERSLTSLAIIKIHIQQANPQGLEPWSTQSGLQNVPTWPLRLLRWKLVITQSIYTLKLEIAHSWPGNLYGDTTAYITTHEHLIKILGCRLRRC